MKCNKDKLFETEVVHLYNIITKIKLAYESWINIHNWKLYTTRLSKRLMNHKLTYMTENFIRPSSVKAQCRVSPRSPNLVFQLWDLQQLRTQISFGRSAEGNNNKDSCRTL